MSAPSAFVCRVVGVTFVPSYPESLYALERLAAEHLLSFDAMEPIPVVLVREPENPHDANAIRVDVPAIDTPIGHLPRWMAERLAPHLDADESWQAEVTDVKISPAHPDRPGIECHIWRVKEDAR
jgi:HIRAN domain-containing protein